MVELEVIRRARILEGLGESDLDALAAIAYEEKAQRGARLFARGEAAERFYLVADGRFALTIALRALDTQVELAVEEMEAGDAFGWSALVEPRRSIYSAYCTSDGTLLSVSGQDAEELMSSRPALGYRLSVNLNRLIGERVRVLQDLWIAEVEQSTSRVNFWATSEISARYEAAVHPQRKRASWLRPISRRRSGTPPNLGH